MSWDENVAWICEEHGSTPDADEPGHDPYVAPGRFHAHIEGPDEKKHGCLEWVELDHALEWARARAARVIVRTNCTPAGRHYTAGEVPIVWDRPDPRRGEMHPYPAEGLRLSSRRLSGYEFLDRSADAQTIPWVGRVTAHIDGGSTGFEAAYDEVLSGHGITPASYQRDAPEWLTFEVVLTVSAATHADATREMWRRCASAVEVVLHSISADPNVEVEIDIDAYPESSPLAERMHTGGE